MDRPEPPAQSAARTSSARQRRANRAVLTAQRGHPGFQGLPAERQRMVHFRSAAQRATCCFATHRARCCSGSRFLPEPLSLVEPLPRFAAPVELCSQHHSPTTSPATPTGAPPSRAARAGDLRKDRQTMGRAPPLGPASRPGTGANPGRNPDPAPPNTRTDGSGPDGQSLKAQCQNDARRRQNRRYP